MKVRSYALILLLVVAVLPLVVLGVVSIHRAETTARVQVRTDTDFLARAIAGRIAAHIADQRKSLQVIGAAIVQARNPDDAENVYTLDDPFLHRLTVYAADGTRLAGPADAAADNPDHAAVRDKALAGQSAASPVRPPPPDANGPFANTITLGEPIVLAGEQKGAVVAQLDLVDIWQPINQVKVGRHGFVRLVGPDGALLAHGDPEERRYAFSAADNLALIQEARAGHTITNEQGKESYAATAAVGQRGWTVLVEQPLDQALAGVHALKYSLFWLVGGTLVFVVAAAFLAGRKAVGGVETLSDHTKVLARGDLSATLDARSGLAEIDALARAMNDMAASLARLNEEAKARERLTTFGRVAAGLTHDLRHPIEAMRNACEGLAHAPGDEHSWELFEWMRQNELPKLKRYLEDLRRLTVAGSMSLQRHEIRAGRFSGRAGERAGQEPQVAGSRVRGRGEGRHRRLRGRREPPAPRALQPGGQRRRRLHHEQAARWQRSPRGPRRPRRRRIGQRLPPGRRDRAPGRRHRPGHVGRDPGAGDGRRFPLNQADQRHRPGPGRGPTCGADARWAHRSDLGARIWYHFYSVTALGASGRI